MRLTFLNGSFVLHKGATSKNISFKAAIRFRPYADKIAERVFNRTLVKFYDAPSKSPPPFLDHHQIEGVNWILTRSRAYLAHAPGAGKTCEAVVASLLAQGEGQTVFIVPPSLTVNWEREIIKWTMWTSQWKTISIIPTTDKKDSVDWRSEFIIVPDSMLTKPWVYSRLEQLKIKLLAVDEASRFKEATSERTKALFGGVGKQQEYFGLVQGARHAVLLDGSPMPNRPMELWAPAIAMAPQSIDFMGQHDFGVKYCAGRFIADGYQLDWDYRGSSNEDELRAKLQKDFMHVVTEDKLGHPERKRSLLFMKDVRDKEMKSWEQRHLQTINLSEIDEDMSQGEIAKHRQKLGLSKVPWVIQYVGERLENKNESILLFAWHREVCKALVTGLSKFKPALVFGETSATEREAAFSNFQKRKLKIIVGNIAAMGRGHNLQKANRVVFAEYSWTDELNKQCEKRASRKGSTQDMVRCDYIVVPNSLDEVVLNSVFTKAKNVKRVIG